MEKEFTKSLRAEETAKELIERLPQLKKIKDANPKIAYFESSKKKRSGGRAVFADCELVKPKMKEFTDCDYIITVYVNNILGITDNQYEILIYHELLHIDCVRCSDGELEAGIHKHDIMDFHSIVDNFGLYWSDDPACKNIYDVLLKDV